MNPPLQAPEVFDYDYLRDKPITDNEIVHKLMERRLADEIRREASTVERGVEELEEMQEAAAGAHNALGAARNRSRTAHSLAANASAAYNKNVRVVARTREKSKQLCDTSEQAQRSFHRLELESANASRIVEQLRRKSSALRDATQRSTESEAQAKQTLRAAEEVAVLALTLSGEMADRLQDAVGTLNLINKDLVEVQEKMYPHHRAVSHRGLRKMAQGFRFGRMALEVDQRGASGAPSPDAAASRIGTLTEAETEDGVRHLTGLDRNLTIAEQNHTEQLQRQAVLIGELAKGLRLLQQRADSASVERDRVDAQSCRAHAVAMRVAEEYRSHQEALRHAQEHADQLMDAGVGEKRLMVRLEADCRWAERLHLQVLGASRRLKRALDTATAVKTQADAALGGAVAAANTADVGLRNRTGALDARIAKLDMLKKELTHVQASLGHQDPSHSVRGAEALSIAGIALLTLLATALGVNMSRLGSDSADVHR